MSFAFSIVIICKNAEATVRQTLQSVCGLSQDILVYDSGSTDSTVKLVQQYNVRLVQGAWLGFGPTRQKAAELALHPWVLMVDADEILTDGLRQELQDMPTPAPHTAYRLLLRHRISSHHLHWGVWRNDYRVRLYNREVLRWNKKDIHETLVIPRGVKLNRFRHGAIHYPALSIPAFQDKMESYAVLTAAQYRKEGKKVTWLKKHISPGYTFFYNYIVRLGFLDGMTGLRLAYIHSRYTFEKYSHM